MANEVHALAPLFAEPCRLILTQRTPRQLRTFLTDLTRDLAFSLVEGDGGYILGADLYLRGHPNVVLNHLPDNLEYPDCNNLNDQRWGNPEFAELRNTLIESINQQRVLTVAQAIMHLSPDADMTHVKIIRPVQRIQSMKEVLDPDGVPIDDLQNIVAGYMSDAENLRETPLLSRIQHVTIGNEPPRRLPNARVVVGYGYGWREVPLEALEYRLLTVQEGGAINERIERHLLAVDWYALPIAYDLMQPYRVGRGQQMGFARRRSRSARRVRRSPSGRRSPSRGARRSGSRRSPRRVRRSRRRSPK